MDENKRYFLCKLVYTYTRRESRTVVKTYIKINVISSSVHQTTSIRVLVKSLTMFKSLIIFWRGVPNSGHQENINRHKISLRKEPFLSLLFLVVSPWG